MKILWVKIGGLWPITSGGRLRSFHLVSQLSMHHAVTVATTHSSRHEEEGLRTQLPACHEIVSVYHAPAKKNHWRFIVSLVMSWFSKLPVDEFKNRVPALRRRVTKLLEEESFDLCIADFLFAVPNIPFDRVPVVFFAHNVEYLIWKRMADVETSLLKRLLLTIEWKKMQRFEIGVASRAAMTIAVSEQDRRVLAPTARSSHAIPTGVDINYFKGGDGACADRADLVFTGSMDWLPNEDAMRFFITDILPLIVEVVPAVTLTIVGRNPSAELRRLAAQEGVHVTGTVDDVRPFMMRSQIYVVPLRIGGGTRLKIFEAFAMGMPVVSTRIGAEGLPVAHNEHLLHADGADEFASAVIALLRDPDLRSRLGRTARELVESEFSWDQIAHRFDGYCRTAVEHA